MFRRVLGSALLAVVLVLAFGASPTLVPPLAEATLPAGCPAAAGVGSVDYIVTATLPAGASANANGVCITLIGTGGTNNSGVLVANPSGCPIPSVGAGTSNVWADWGTTNCVAPGATVKITFKNGGTIVPGVQTGAATWSLMGGGTVTGDVAVAAGSVGGVAGAPNLSQLGAAASTGDGTSVTPFAAGGAAAVLLILVSGVTGMWYVKRRRGTA